MPSRFEVPTFEALVTEQETVQAGKFQGRTLEEYSHYIFPAQHWHKPQSSAVTDFLRPLCLDERVSLDGVLRGLCEIKGDTPVRWVDMGGGRSLPMRQLATDPNRRAHLTMTNVDLFDFGINGLLPNETTHLEELAPGMTSAEAAPLFIQDDIETVTLPEPADLITSVEVVQYLNNPLGAISNWYNQLADNGIMIISTEHSWSCWIRYEEAGQNDWEETPVKHFLQTLEVGGVAFAAMSDTDWSNGFRPKLNPDTICTMTIQKLPGTQLLVNSQVKEIGTSFYDFKAVYYNRQATGSIIEIAESQ